MNRFLFISLIAAVLIASAGAGVAAAQSNSSADDSEDSEPSEIVMQVDNTTRVTNVDWTEDTAAVTLESTSSGWTTVTLYDISPIEEQGGHQIDDETVTLRDNETATVEITMAKPDNPQLSLSTDSGAALLVGPDKGWNPFSGVAATWGHVQIAVLYASLGGIGCFALFGWHRIADRFDSADLVKP